jgi:hypothetical protein
VVCLNAKIGKEKPQSYMKFTSNSNFSPMSNPLNLTPGQKYKVVKEFLDYDKNLHHVGETWTFAGTNFLPYEDGLTLHVAIDGFPTQVSYRLQWRQEEQAFIIENFTEFVELG